jgi:hypothetical protein
VHEPGAGGEGEKQASKGTQQTSAPQKVKSLTVPTILNAKPCNAGQSLFFSWEQKSSRHTTQRSHKNAPRDPPLRRKPSLEAVPRSVAGIADRHKLCCWYYLWRFGEALRF